MREQWAINMKEKLKILYNFLLKNRHYNKKVQEEYYISTVTSGKTTEKKMVDLLYEIANTQSQPKIDKLAIFFKLIHQSPNCLKTLEAFINRISSKKENKYINLYNGLRAQQGWGNKTAALFTKTLYHLHNGNYRKDLKIWPDVPKNIAEDDDLFLPVDAVIIAIFKSINHNVNWDFNKVTKELKKYYSGDEIEVWDDLWFWGFITQKGSGDKRTFGWNENKYWMLKESEKKFDIINEIKIKADEFLRIIGSLK